MMRLFVGIALPPSLRDRLSVMSSGLSGARWISPENLHLTLCFLGQVDDHLADDIDLTLSSIEAPAFDYTVNGINTFGRGHQVHTLWAKVEAVPSLMALQAKIETAMLRLGQEPEHRKFTPHITLARTKGASTAKVAEWLETSGGLSFGPVHVGSFALFRSHLGSGPPYYEVLSEYLLEAEQSG